jgi:hypothetical protein
MWSALDLAETDWRDPLVSAGLAKDIDAHQKWWLERAPRPGR